MVTFAKFVTPNTILTSSLKKEFVKPKNYSPNGIKRAEDRIQREELCSSSFI